MLGKTKKYQINFNGANYNFKTRKYETRDGRNITYGEASRDKWMCEKCSETFPTFKMLLITRIKFIHTELLSPGYKI